MTLIRTQGGSGLNLATHVMFLMDSMFLIDSMFLMDSMLCSLWIAMDVKFLMDVSNGKHSCYVPNE